MKARKLIFVDGAKTREASRKMAGKGGLSKLCKEKGLSQPVLSDICINGYGTEKTVRRFMEAGIPIITSDRPVPDRAKKPYTRGQKTTPEDPKKSYFKLGDETIEIPADEINSPLPLPLTPVPEKKQISFEDFTGETKVRQMRDIITKGLTAIINELNKI